MIAPHSAGFGQVLRPPRHGGQARQAKGSRNSARQVPTVRKALTVATRTQSSQPFLAPSSYSLSGRVSHFPGKSPGPSQSHHYGHPHSLHQKFDQRMRQHIKRRRDIVPIGNDPARHSARPDEGQRLSPPPVREPAPGIDVYAEIALQREESRIVPVTPLAECALQVASQPLAEPRRRAPAGKQHVGDFVKVGGRVPAHAVHRNGNRATASRGDARVAAQLKSQPRAPAPPHEPFDFTDAAGGEKRKRGGLLARKGCSLISHHGAALPNDTDYALPVTLHRHRGGFYTARGPNRLTVVRQFALMDSRNGSLYRCRLVLRQLSVHTDRIVCATGQTDPVPIR